MRKRSRMQSIGRSRRLDWLWLVNGLVIGVLALWLLLANTIAAPGEQSIRQAWGSFVQSFSPQANPTALKLKQLQSALQIEQIQKPLTNYLTAQLKRPTDAIDPFPADLQRYLTQKSTQIAALKTHLLTGQLPVWDMSYISKDKMPDYSVALPSFLNLVNLQRVLLLSAVQQEQAGQPEAALETLTASWKLNQALSKRPELVAQLVTIIGINQHAGILRKLDRLPAEWQTRLTLPDLRQSLTEALRLEAFIGAETFRTYLLVEPEKLSDMGSASPRSPFLRLQQLFQQPYFRLVAIDNFQIMQRTLNNLPKNFCAFDANAVIAKAAATPARWNSVSWTIPSFLNQFQKVGKLLIHWELTQKLLQIKALANQRGSFPTTISGIETSSVCPDLRWAYQVAADGTAAISLNNPPAWFKVSENDLPLSYSLRMQDLTTVQRK